MLRETRGLAICTHSLICLPARLSLLSIYHVLVYALLGCRHCEYGAHSHRQVQRPYVRALGTTGWGYCYSRGGGQSAR